MERGSYVTASGGLLQLKKLDVVNNNLANVNTPGFKRQYLGSTQRSFEQTLAGMMKLDDPYAKPDQQRSPEVVSTQAYTDFTAGPVKETGNPLDVALRNANDFFVVETPQGAQYTRAGNFTLDVNGQLVTADGMQVQGDGGPITVDGAGAQILDNGGVYVNREEVGRLRVVRIPDPSVLERVGGTRFAPRDPAAAGSFEQIDAEVVAKALEMSNVSAITSMIDLVSTNRAFELYTKTARTIDEINTTAINQVGRPPR
jgi:flagellar basal-body rod protein FlgF